MTGKTVASPPARRMRADGWTAARQRVFLKALAATGVVRDACRKAGISSTSAYRTRRISDSFAQAWNKAQARGLANIETAAFERAVLGWDEVVVRDGREVSRKKRYSDSLLQVLIKRGDLKNIRQGMSQAELEQHAEEAARAAGGTFDHPRKPDVVGCRLMIKLAEIEYRLAEGVVNCRTCGGRGLIPVATPEDEAECAAHRAKLKAALDEAEAEAERQGVAREAWPE
jgi:hypothetical protein